jgi:hypothetical protein
VRQPVLPPGVGRLTLRGVRVGAATLDLGFTGEGERVQVDVLGQTAPLTVQIEMQGGAGPPFQNPPSVWDI